MPSGSGRSESSTARSGTGREFVIQGHFFDNGCFFIISEGSPRIGAITASISAAGGKVNSAKVIPSKFDSMFLTNVSEKVAATLNGICLVSLYTSTSLKLEDMKAIMQVVMDIMDRNRSNEEQKGQ